MKKLVTILGLSFLLLSCSLSSDTEALDKAQTGDQRLNQSVDDQPLVSGTPDEVQVEQGDYQSAAIEGYQDDNSANS
jgi:hypothetical protein